MLVAIYARKSKLTHSGESISNQVQICKDYIALHIHTDESIDYEIYTDEGFSGKDTNRPAFQQFLEATNHRSFKLFICYRLDRVSRSVLDFATTYDFLEKKEIQFISVSEQFDTSTPMGVAMLHITIVFAQLERQAIAARVRDNMLALAQSGRWLGGICPTGFQSQPIEYIDNHLNKKKMYQLIPNTPELEKVHLIYDKFLELQSLRGLETYLINASIKTTNNKYYSPSTLKQILTNPVYAVADQNLYQYFTAIKCMVCNPPEAFDGSHSVLAYNKRSQIGSQMLDNVYEKWIVAIANHQGIIIGSKWVQIQRILDNNTHTTYCSNHPLKQGILPSLIRCKHCDSTMRIKKGRISRRTGTPTYSYICSLKETSHKKQCAMPNLIGQDIDHVILHHMATYIKEAPGSYQIFLAQLKSMLPSSSNTTLSTDPLTLLHKKKKELQVSTANVMKNFESLSADKAHLGSFFLEKLDSLALEMEEIDAQIESLESYVTNGMSHDIQLATLLPMLLDIDKLLSEADIDTQRACMRLLVGYMEWDGDGIDVYFRHRS